MRHVDLLTRDELLALAGLLRTIVLADREIDGYELDALDGVGRRVALLGSVATTYRTAERAMGAGEFRALFGEACRKLPTDDAVRKAAEAVVRPEAREILFAILRDVAASNGIVPEEQAILDWLLERWGLVTGPVVEPA